MSLDFFCGATPVMNLSKEPSVETYLTNTRLLTSSILCTAGKGNGTGLVSTAALFLERLLFAFLQQPSKSFGSKFVWTCIEFVRQLLLRSTLFVLSTVKTIDLRDLSWVKSIFMAANNDL